MFMGEAVELDIEYFVDALRDDSHRIRKAANWIAKEFAFRCIRVSVSVVDDPAIRELNQQQLGHDWATDVVSFVIEAEQDSVDGEVVASADTARRLCEKAGWSAEDELLLYIVHGMLHVAGLDDIEKSDREVMREAERNCLLAIGLPHALELNKSWGEISN